MNMNESEEYFLSVQSGRCWDWTNFGWPGSQVHGSGRVCFGSGGSRSRPSDMESGKPAFMPRALSLRGPSL